MKDEVRSCLVSVERGRVSVGSPQRAAEPGEIGWLAVFHFRADLAVFAGHFPGAPMVPAVHLVEAARLTLERGLDQPLRLLEIQDARFTAPVGPGDRVEVQLRAEERADENDWLARAVVRRGEELAAKLRLRLAVISSRAGRN